MGREANSEHFLSQQRGPSRQSLALLLSFAVVPYAMARLLVMFGVKANEWNLTSKLGVIVAFIRRAGSAELISAIFYCYTFASLALVVPCVVSVLGRRRAFTTKLTIFAFLMFAYGVLIAHILIRGPSEGSFEPSLLRSALGIQAAAKNDITYAAMCATLTVQISIPIATSIALIISTRKDK